SVDRAAPCDGEVWFETLQFADWLAPIPGRPQNKHPCTGLRGLENPPIEQDRGRHQDLRASRWSHQSGKLFACLHVLQALSEKSGDMLADDGVRSIGKTEFLQPCRTALARQVVNAGSGEKTVDNNLLQRLAIESRRDSCGNQAGAARGDRDWRLRQPTIFKQDDLGFGSGIHKR